MSAQKQNRQNWLDSRAARNVSIFGVLLWAALLVVAVSKGSWILATLDAGLLAASIWTLFGSRNRRRRSSPPKTP